MIVFENDGLMPLEAATTMGLNVKEGTDPIGFFGTGLKYAIAVCLRLGGKFRLFLGETEYEFRVKKGDFRGKEFGFIYMRKRHGWHMPWTEEKMGYTTELGKHWEPWMAVREIESNTRDEGGNSFVFADDDIGILKENKTVIIIECPEMEQAYTEQVIFNKQTNLLYEFGNVQVFEGEADHIFYRGLRVTDLELPSKFTYNLTDGVTLTEDRTSKYPYSDQCRIMEAFMACSNLAMLESVLDSNEKEHFEASLPWDNPYVVPEASYVGAVKFRVMSGGTVPNRIRSNYEAAEKEKETEKYLRVRLTQAQIENLVDILTHHNGDHEAIIIQLKKAIKDEGIPF